MLNKLSLQLLASIILLATVVITTTAHAGDTDPEAINKAYKKTEKTCKQIERDHDKMTGEHKLMFKAWQEKSSPLLAEHQEVITECNTALSILKDLAKRIDETVSDDSAKEALFSDFEKTGHLLEDIMVRHKTLREKHERLFHEMMGH